MSAVSMATPRDSSEPVSPLMRVGIATRVRRAIALSGNMSLIIGSLTGLFQVHPELLEGRFPFSITPGGIAVGGIGLLGLFESLVVGLSLRRTRVMLRFATAMFVMIAGLIVSQLIVGIGLRQPLRDVLVGFGNSLIISQIALGTLGVVVGIQVGRPASLPSAANPVPSPPPGQQPRGRRRQQRRPSASASTGTENTAPSVQLVTPQPRPKPRRRLFAGKRVHLGKEKTSVCPYCLDEVKPHDPRGKVVCKVCGTPHHADCWAITGKCEVPHLHT